ncbi:hypothetical protein RUND412_006987 [Rhizina undulata]
MLSARTRYFDVAKEGGFKEGVKNEFRLKENKDDRELIKHRRVYAIADLWDIPNLKELCKMRFEHQLTTLWTSDTFMDAIREVAYKNLKNLYAKDDFKDLLKENGEFASDLIRLRVAEMH